MPILHSKSSTEKEHLPLCIDSAKLPVELQQFGAAQPRRPIRSLSWSKPGFSVDPFTEFLLQTEGKATEYEAAS